VGALRRSSASTIGAQPLRCGWRRCGLSVLPGWCLVNPVAFDECRPTTLRALQRNTARGSLFEYRAGCSAPRHCLTPVLSGSVANARSHAADAPGAYIAPFVGQEGVTHLLALARSVRDIDLDDLDLTQVRADTMIVRGEKDAWWGRAWRNGCRPRFRTVAFVSMPDVGRLIPEEAPDELADLIASFVSPHIKGSAEEIVISE
jgi:pimeloyl-ACP methyl ester carboxylesterase